MQAFPIESTFCRWTQESQPPDSSDRIFVDDASPLGVENLLFPIMLLVMGGVFAIVCYCGEMMLLRNSRSYRTRSIIS